LITDNCQEPIGEGLDLSEVLKTITKKFGYVPNEIWTYDLSIQWV